MPTYEYYCAECDRTFDIVQSFHDDPLTTCPTCGATVRKVFGSVGIVFKGSGFYKTDSRSGGSSKAPTGSDTSPSTPSDGSTSSSDSGGSTSSDAGSSKGSDAPAPKSTTDTKAPSSGKAATSS